jgi:hypothetical protein
MRPLQAHCYYGLGRLYSQAGQVEQAYTELSMAIQMYRDMEMMFWLPKAEATLTAIQGETRNKLIVREIWPIFTRLVAVYAPRLHRPQQLCLEQYGLRRYAAEGPPRRGRDTE